MTDLVPLLPLALLGAVLGLDVVSFPQAMISRPLVAATVSLEQVSAVLAGERPEAAGPGPKIHVDPLLS